MSKARASQISDNYSPREVPEGFKRRRKKPRFARLSAIGDQTSGSCGKPCSRTTGRADRSPQVQIGNRRPSLTASRVGMSRNM